VAVPFLPTGEERAYVTYNNVVIDGKTVFMPVYDMPELDEAAEAVWRSEGFEVRRVPAADLLPCRGAVHCLVNVLERS
jgi:agmatine/peptidylarginine deiminase